MNYDKLQEVGLIQFFKNFVSLSYNEQIMVISYLSENLEEVILNDELKPILCSENLKLFQDKLKKLECKLPELEAAFNEHKRKKLKERISKEFPKEKHVFKNLRQQTEMLNHFKIEEKVDDATHKIDYKLEKKSLKEDLKKINNEITEIERKVLNTICFEACNE